MKGTKTEPRTDAQETGISCKTMLELMGLPPEAKRNLAGILTEGDDHKAVKELIDPLLDLSLHIKQMRAVAECFADDYIDIAPGITRAMAVAHTEEHYENLFNAFFNMIADIDKEAEGLQKAADQLFKETLARI